MSTLSKPIMHLDKTTKTTFFIAYFLYRDSAKKIYTSEIVFEFHEKREHLLKKNKTVNNQFFPISLSSSTKKGKQPRVSLFSDNPAIAFSSAPSAPHS